MPGSRIRPQKQRRRRTCGKRYFRDRLSAELTLASIWRGGEDRGTSTPRRAYDCPTCSGWHLTSKAPRSARAPADGHTAHARNLVRGQEHQVAHYVAAYRAEYGQGPTWSELAATFSWTPSQCALVVQYLSDQGWLAASREPRSLRTGQRSV